MTKKEAAQILAILKAAYPNHYKMGAEEAVGVVGVWAIQFKDVPADIVAMAVNRHIGKSTFPPSIAEIKEHMHDLHCEAYTTIATRQKYNALSPQEQEFINRVMEITDRYSGSNASPSLVEMIRGGGLPMLTTGEE